MPISGNVADVFTQGALKGKLGTQGKPQGHSKGTWPFKALEAFYLVDSNHVQSFQDILEMTNEKTIHKKLRMFCK